ncbi:MAG: DUF2065 family protein [Paracoccaceae bacterium]
MPGGIEDFIAGIGVALALEGVVLAIFVRRLPDLLARAEAVGPEQIRWAGFAMAAAGATLYVLVRG